MIWRDFKNEQEFFEYLQVGAILKDKDFDQKGVRILIKFLSFFDCISGKTKGKKFLYCNGTRNKMEDWGFSVFRFYQRPVE